MVRKTLNRVMMPNMAHRKKDKPHQLVRVLNEPRRRFAIITSRYHEDITRPMHDAAKATLEKHDAELIHELWVPGAWELPFAAQCLADSEEFDALVALGCVIRGETTHHEHIAREAATGLMKVSLMAPIAIGFGLLTTDTVEQARARAGGELGNKGIDAALSAIEMSRLERKSLSDAMDELAADFRELGDFFEPPPRRRGR